MGMVPALVFIQPKNFNLLGSCEKKTTFIVSRLVGEESCGK